MLGWMHETETTCHMLARIAQQARTLHSIAAASFRVPARAPHVLASATAAKAGLYVPPVVAAAVQGLLLIQHHSLAHL
jgi:hypothetical protein